MTNLEPIFEHLKRRGECFEAIHHPKSLVLCCKVCGQRWRLRKTGRGVQPGPIDEIMAHADKHLMGHSLASH